MVAAVAQAAADGIWPGGVRAGHSRYPRATAAPDCVGLKSRKPLSAERSTASALPAVCAGVPFRLYLFSRCRAGRRRRHEGLRMSFLLIFVIVITAAGSVLLGLMFRRDDNRVGLAGILVLIVASVTAMVYAISNE
jgi:hypothetical protein